MTLKHAIRNMSAAALLASACFVAGSQAAAQSGPDTEEIDRLFEELAKPEQPGWQQIEEAIALEWSKSGSASMDLLLQRGREALTEGEFETALEHLTALTDHAPDFAEAWNSRATVFFRMELYGLALDDISRALALEPRHFGAMIGLATILRELEMEEEALEVLRRTQELHPHRPTVKEGIEALSSRLEGEAL
ncbi:MAG: tetratricopeptide repeat protein [Pseudomonadota bacterium]